MTTLTIPEMTLAMHEATGLHCTVKVSGRPPQEAIRFCLNNVEILHVPDFSDGEELRRYIPENMDQQDQFFATRMQLLGILESSPDGIEILEDNEPALKEVFRRSCDAVPVSGTLHTPAEMMTAARERILKVIWDMKPLALNRALRRLQNTAS